MATPPSPSLVCFPATSEAGGAALSYDQLAEALDERPRPLRGAADPRPRFRSCLYRLPAGRGVPAVLPASAGQLRSRPLGGVCPKTPLERSLRLAILSDSGCACMCPVKQFSTASTRFRRLPKRGDLAYETQTSAHIWYGHACGIGARHVPLRLLLATPRVQPLRKSDR
jgi:hypothetical protein